MPVISTISFFFRFSDSKEPSTWAEVKHLEEENDPTNAVFSFVLIYTTHLNILSHIEQEGLITEEDVAQIPQLEDPLGLKR